MENNNNKPKMGFNDLTMETLRDRAETLKDCLARSQIITDSMTNILGSFDLRLSALETAMRPTQIKTHSMRQAHGNIDKTLKFADAVLVQFELVKQAEAEIMRGPHEDLESYLEAVNQLKKIVRFFSTNKNLKSSIGVITHSTTLLQKASLMLEEEFRQLLHACSKPVEPDRLLDCLPASLRPSTANGDAGKKTHADHNKDLEDVVYRPPTLVPAKVVPLLHDLAQQMLQTGQQQQVFIIYREARSACMEGSLKKLGVEKLSKDDVQKMQWEALEAKIGNWIHFVRIAVKLLFAAERKVSDQIFEGMESFMDQCFAEGTASAVSLLLSFGEAIAKSKRSPEKLFVLLDMYEIMKEVQPEFNTLYASISAAELRESVSALTLRLAETAQETFVDFEEAVEKDATKTAVLDGTVHPLTSYVINYVKFLFDYQSTLKQLFLEFEAIDPDAQLAKITTRIMQALQNNLDGKSKNYKDQALTQLFMMNNIHYIVRSVRRSDAKDMLGDDWVQIHRRVVQQHANQYKRISWSKILQCLTVAGGDGISTAGVSRGTVKEKFKTFNTQFEELHQRQSTWTVPDSELRESLRLAVAEVLLPAYRSFKTRFGPMIEGGKNPSKYIRFQPEDLERMLAEFFEGKQAQEQKRLI
ncbi:putative exocyst complex component Exo70, cullin repeat-like-containing domain superfamily [Helianthus annuus]|uniref:Exocyst subunit Exo70 family protein n=1 Tax=Helianthus annuus TaxID=4232 RepID=A0A251VIK5_HELAN|nr:exocyst complex component EXO70A1 isoform X2 [Helianthus annuus]KAF5819537.1 putative exocyst complex component Exo70, cullin repeat-like-containing domain superfamily [Helianthus annuus]KAJ0619694.1 putative exocyst complex component Exo70, cullin repeat-like-containing domain superfamily [Helianthus annuus]KAJ0954088.1 putative exocyst complex component Exo70, cullin repeat-like-containing domain superfamily [Helianthus annuus]